MKCNFEDALVQRYGAAREYWDVHDAMSGVQKHIAFEGITNGQINYIAAEQFQTDFISSMASKIPVVALAAFGDRSLHTLQRLGDHVSRGLPLLLIDCRKRVQTSDSPRVVVKGGAFGDDPPVLRSERASGPFLEAQAELNALSGKLSAEFCYDWQTFSTMAYLHTIVQACRAKRGCGSTKQLKQPHRELYMWQAVKQEKETVSIGESEDSFHPDSKEHESDIHDAIDLLMMHTGKAIEVLSRLCMEITLKAVESIDKSTSIQELLDSCKKNMYNLRFVLWSQASLAAFQILVNEAKNNGRPVDSIKGDLHQLLGKGIEENKAYDARNMSLQNVLGDAKKWALAYDIFRSTKVTSCSIFDIDSANAILQSDLVGSVDRLPKRNSLEQLVLLRNAWTLANMFEDYAIYYKRLSRASYGALSVLGVLMIVIVTVGNTLPNLLKPDPFRYLVLAVSLALNFIAALSTLSNPMQKWLKLRDGSEKLKSEIWKFRTRIMTNGSSEAKTGTLLLQSERLAASHLAKQISHVRRVVLQAAGLQETSFYAVPTSTDDISRPQQMQQQQPSSADAVEYVSGLEKKGRFRSLSRAHFRHGLYQRHGDETKKALPADADSHHAPATPQDYMRWRMEPALEFYQGKIPSYTRRKMIMQILVLTSTIIGTVLATIGQPSWTAIVSSAAAAISAWLEFTGLAQKLDRFSAAVEALGELQIWWQSLDNVERAASQNVSKLVRGTEKVICSESASWLRGAQEAQQQAQKLHNEYQGKKDHVVDFRSASPLRPQVQPDLLS